VIIKRAKVKAFALFYCVYDVYKAIMVKEKRAENENYYLAGKKDASGYR